MSVFKSTAFNKRFWRTLLACAFVTAASGVGAKVPDPVRKGAQSVDPLLVKIDASDVARFAALWEKTGGHPTAAQLASDYIAHGGEGLKIFTPDRIISGENMAKQIAAHHDLYEGAVHKCLPWIEQNNGELRSIYLALHGLFPDRPLPHIYMVVGGGNSGGTSGSNAQVLGLEILCRDGPTAPQFSAQLRTFFAHETAHTFQGGDDDANLSKREPLLTAILLEGTADYVASLVTGGSPNPARDEFGAAHQADIWRQFLKDRAYSNTDFDRVKQKFGSDGRGAFSHWLYNGDRGRLPGWEPDMGYWLGMQIAKAYVEQAPDPHAALNELLALRDPTNILLKSGYPERIRR